VSLWLSSALTAGGYDVVIPAKRSASRNPGWIPAQAYDPPGCVLSRE